jgi:hypothetical protein
MSHRRRKSDAKADIPRELKNSLIHSQPGLLAFVNSYSRRVSASDFFGISEHFHQAHLVRITFGAFAVWQNPFGMLRSQVVMNLSQKLGVGLDSVNHSY